MVEDEVKDGIEWGGRAKAREDCMRGGRGETKIKVCRDEVMEWRIRSKRWCKRW